MGMDYLKNIRQGKHFEIEVDEEDQLKAEKKIEYLLNLTRKLNGSGN